MPVPGDSIVKEAAKTLGLLAPEVYHDLLQPAAKEVGQKLVIVAKAVGVALAPLESAVWGYQKIKEYLSATVAAKLADKPAEEIKSPPRIIAGPVIMNMVFADQEPHLKEMYANLLASAMHIPSSNRVHPSFVQMIQQLTPSEAEILRGIARDFKRGSTLFDEGVAVLNHSGTDMLMAMFGANNVQDVTGSEQWRALCMNYIQIDELMINAFYRNFLRLGILEERLESVGPNGVGNHVANINETRKLEKKVVLSEFGDLFLDVCVR